jgi:peptidoglycan/xylan/chitin deacetylase (PgdA/CDA1 family)
MNGCLILTYHVIDSPENLQESAFCCAPALFRSHMIYLRQEGYRIIALRDLVDCIKNKTMIPARSVIITFDDGAACSYDKALSILEEYGYQATFFVISGLLGKTNEWVQDIGFPTRKMLTREQLKALKGAGMEIGSHTVSHCHLDRLDVDTVRAEVRISKAQLEDVLGDEVIHFAYPFGGVNPVARREVAAAGYRSACSTIPGRIGSNSNLFTLNRIDIRGNDTLWRFRFKLSFAVGSVPPYSDIRRIGRQLLVRAGLLSPRPWQLADNE